MSTCLGHPCPAERRKVLQVREPSEGAPSSIKQGLHGLCNVKKISYKQSDNHKNSTKGTREQKGSLGHLTLGEQPCEGAFYQRTMSGSIPERWKAPEDRSP